MAMDIRVLTAGELEELIRWASGEGWNPGIHDAAAFHAAGAENFLGAFEHGELVSGISAVAYGDCFGFIGLFITRPDARGRGYGRAVFRAGMERLAHRTVGLDGVPAQQDYYRRNGFVADYGTTRYSGTFAERGERTEHVIPFTVDLLERVIAFDRDFFLSPRPDFLARWLELSERASVYVDGDEVVGFGSVRACEDVFKVGPLFARSATIAAAILADLAEACEGEIHLDVPNLQMPFIASLEASGLKPGFETARMYRGPAASIDLNGVFAVTSLELG
jgi:GNAT superfamily N-acetyltransferase